ncbi:hypothetical protein RRK63_004437 [Vibrio fluvialis]|nr:hypothetical protein [Vibrio fluvialis]
MDLFEVDIDKIVPYRAKELYKLSPKQIQGLDNEISRLKSFMSEVRIEHPNFESMIRRYTNGDTDAKYLLGLAKGVRENSLSIHDREFLAELFEDGAKILSDLSLETDGSYRSKKVGSLFGKRLGASNTSGSLPKYYIYWVFEQIKYREINVMYHAIEVNESVSNKEKYTYVQGVNICDFLDINADMSVTAIAEEMGERMGIGAKTIQNLVTDYKVLGVVRYLAKLYKLCEKEVLAYLISNNRKGSVSEVRKIVAELDREYLKKHHWCLPKTGVPTAAQYVIDCLDKGEKISIDDNEIVLLNEQHL